MILDTDLPICIATHLPCGSSDPQLAAGFQNVVHFRWIIVPVYSYQVYNDILLVGKGRKEHSCSLEPSLGPETIHYYCCCHDHLTDCKSLVFGYSHLFLVRRETTPASGEEFHQSAAQMHYDDEPRHRWFGGPSNKMNMELYSKNCRPFFSIETCVSRVDKIMWDWYDYSGVRLLIDAVFTWLNTAHWSVAILK